MIKETKRIFYWVIFFLKTGYLRNADSVVSIGSSRVQKVLSLLFYRGQFTSIDYAYIPPSKGSCLLKNPKFVKADFFKYKCTTDLLIFDHSVDDILAAMFEKNPLNKRYDEVMDNIKYFDYNNPKFIEKINKILKQAKSQISPNGKIIISNYLSSYDYIRKTTDISLALLSQLSKISHTLGLKIDYRSDRFLVLSR